MAWLIVCMLFVAASYHFYNLAPWTTTWEQVYDSCFDAYKLGGLFSEKNTAPLFVSKPGGSTIECKFENMLGGTEFCPNHWFGSMQNGECYKVFQIPLDNNDASLHCYENNADLLQMQSENEETMILDVLKGSTTYSWPTHPGFYHMGTYQHQSRKIYYHRNGDKV